MSVTIVDRDTLLRNLRKSRLLSPRKLRLVIEKLAHVKSAREIAKALASWRLVTKFQAKMLLLGRKNGFHVGPYRILDELGHGGMGHVYMAVHRPMKRVVALKILSPQTISSERAQRMFKREIRAASQLSHPNIVMAFDASAVDGQHYLAMEYVSGPNLEQYVNKHGPLPVGLACEIIFQAAGGLQHAHEKGVVHRDIKPANLLVQEEPGAKTLQVKILDFGLAHLRQSEETAASASSGVHTLMGTPDFLSPEQSKNLRDADIRSDLYSLGCTLYFLLTGQVPFPGGSILDKLNRHDRHDAAPIEQLRPDVPKSIAMIVRKLMAKNPADRYQTPDQLMDALAPHAAPSPMAWPKGQSAARPSAVELDSSNEVTAIQEAKVDTEPRAQAATDVSDQDSLLEWVDAHRKERRKIRRVIVATAMAISGLCALGITGLVTWG